MIMKNIFLLCDDDFVLAGYVKKIPKLIGLHLPVNEALNFQLRIKEEKESKANLNVSC